MTDHLLVEKKDGIATLTMNRPKVRNALSLEMRFAMYDAFEEIEHDPDIRCVLLRGAEGHFMSGGDIKGFEEYTKMTPEKRNSYFERRIHDFHPMIMKMQNLRQPIVAVIEGAAAGAGMSFMMACDLAIASTNSFYKFSYVAIGASPDGSGSYYMPRIIGVRKALELAMLGDTFDAQKAYDLGLVNFLIEEENFEEETAKLARRLADGATTSMGSIKKLMYASHANSVETQLAMEAKGFGNCAATDDWLEGVSAFLEKRKPVFKGK